MIYRKDIQILRGMAVLLVVLFHLQVSLIPSGFLGVDVFFVISGFLMAILYDPASKSEFFLRRAKRLLPTYYIVILLTLAISIFLTIPNEFNQVSEQSIYAIFFSSNIGFWIQNSYFSKVEFNPLLHLWSLGVEIQFYLIVPLLYWIHSRMRLFVPLALILSLVVCFVIVGMSPKTSFFMMPLRLWEFLMGYGIAIYFTDNGKIKYPSFQWLGVIAIALLISIPTFYIDGESLNFIDGHPGLFSFIVSLATSLVLAFGMSELIEKSKIGNLFELLGKYSYSIYMVHFPVIVLFLYEPFSGTVLKTNNISTSIILLGIIITSSILMYHLVEKSVRDSTKFVGKLFIILLLILSAVILGKIYQQFKYSQEESAIFNAWEDRAPYRCGKMIRIFEPSSVSCILNDDIDMPIQRILLVGDSHADAIKSTFVSVASELNVRVHFIVENIPLKGGLTSQAVVDEAISKRIDTIILHYFSSGIKVGNIKELVDLAAKQNILVTFIMPIPIWDKHIPKALFDHYKYNISLPIQSHEDFVNSNQKLHTDLSSIQSNHFLIYNVESYLCSKNCQMTDVLGRPYYFDEHHLTLTGSEVLRPLFRKIIADSNIILQQNND